MSDGLWSGKIKRMWLSFFFAGNEGWRWEGAGIEVGSEIGPLRGGRDGMRGTTIGWRRTKSVSQYYRNKFKVKPT